MLSYAHVKIVNLIAILLLPLAAYDWVETGFFVVDVSNYYFLIFLIMGLSYVFSRFLIVSNEEYSKILIYMLNFQHNKSKYYKKISVSFCLCFFTFIFFILPRFEIFFVFLFYWLSWPMLICAWREADRA